jgi:hypothetical protein
MRSIPRIPLLAAAVGLLLFYSHQNSKASLSSKIQSNTGVTSGQVWPSEPPPGCPFSPSHAIAGVRFTGRQARYTEADTWYPSWASDGNLYSPWTDGKVNNLTSTSFGPNATTGHATILGKDPLNLNVTDAGIFKGDPIPYGGRYPCGSLVYNGVWYYGTYCLMDSDGDPSKGLNWDILGPFVGFRYSKDHGRSWVDTPHTPSHPLFGEPPKPGDPVKFGVPHFVDFGRDMQFSPDGKAYLVAHGALIPDPLPRLANASWITGDAIYLARVKPTPETINDPPKYEFFAGLNQTGQAQWTRDFAKIQPLVAWNNNCGNVSMTYDAPLKKYLMWITDGGNTISEFNTYLLESDQITGPWQLAVYMRHFGPQGYFVNLPTKFISADGQTAWLCYAANFTNGYLGTRFKPNPPGSGYGMCLHEIRLLMAPKANSA